MANSIIELHLEIPADLEGNVFGQFDEHLKLIERTLNVTLISRDGILKILGTEGSASQAEKTDRRTGSSGAERKYHHKTERQLCPGSCHGAAK